MPTYTFTRTREQLRDLIGRRLGIKGEGQSLSAEEAAIVHETMDLRLKEMHALGVLWWQVSGAATSVSLVAATASTSLAAVTDFLFPVTFSVVVGTEEKQLEIIGHSQYQAIPNKAEAGEPEVAFFSGGTVKTWPVQSSNMTAKLTYEAIAADTEANTAPDVPVAMLRSFADVVAFDLLGDFSVGTEISARVTQRYPDAMRTIFALSQQRVDATAVAPEWF